MKKSYLKYFMVLIVSLFFTGCQYSRGVRVMSIEKNSINSMSSSFKLFDGEDRKTIKIKADEKLEITYEKNIEAGTLDIKLLDKGETVQELKENSGTEIIESKEDKQYTLVIKGTGAKGSYKVQWNKK